MWLCDIPPDTVNDTYAAEPWRLERPVDEVVAVLGPGLSRWWDRLTTAGSQCRRRGGRVAVGADGGGEECVAASEGGIHESAADGLLVIATAAHRSDVPGGWGRPGDCEGRAPVRPLRSPAVPSTSAPPTSPSAWGDRPTLDLIQHEMGHARSPPLRRYRPTGGTRAPST